MKSEVKPGLKLETPALINGCSPGASALLKQVVAKSRRASTQTVPGGHRAAKSTSSGARPLGVSSGKVDSPPTKKHSKTQSADDRPMRDFSHLLAASVPDNSIDTSREDFAAAIVAAAEKTRRPAVKDSAKPVGTAKQILDAGQKARTPTGTGAAKSDGLAAQIVAAGRKARKLGQ